MTPRHPEAGRSSVAPAMSRASALGPRGTLFGGALRLSNPVTRRSLGSPVRIELERGGAVRAHPYPWRAG